MRCSFFISHLFPVPLLLVCLLFTAPLHVFTAASAAAAPAPSFHSLLALRELAPFFAEAEKKGITRAEAAFDPERTWRVRLLQAAERLIQEATRKSAANSVVKASSDRASDVYVTFARPFNFEDFRKAWLDKDIVLQVTMRGVSVPVQHIAQENPRVLRIGFDQDQSLEEAALVSVTLHDVRTKPTFGNSSSSFVLTDEKLPVLLHTRQTGSGTFELEFDEPIYTGMRSSGYELWQLNGHSIYGRLAQSKPKSAASRLSGDFRRFAVLELNQGARSYYQPPGKKNLLIGSGMADYAGHRSGKRLENVVVEFTSPPAVEPVPTVSAQSPEQFMLRFPSETVSMHGYGLALDAGDIRLERQNGWDEEGTPRWTTAELQPYKDWALEYDGNAAYYVQIKRDWSHILQTEDGHPAYHTPGYNRVRITLLKGRAKDAGSGTVNQSDYAYELALPADTLPPKIENVYPSFAPVPGQEILTVTFNEPVQIPNATRHLTPAREEGNVPAPVFELVSLQGNARIALSPLGFLTDKDDKTYRFSIPQEAVKQAGIWKLVVQNLSDDVGNTAASLTHPVSMRPLQLLPHKPLEAPALVFGIAVDQAQTGEARSAEDVVVLQFNTILSADARKPENYLIAGRPLSAEAKVLLRSTRFDSTKDGNISDEDQAGTRVTLLLPADTFGAHEDGASTRAAEGVHFNVQVQSETGDAINKWGTLPYARTETPDTVTEEIVARYARKEASIADRLWLASVIGQAESELAAAAQGEAAGEFPQEAIHTFRLALAEAKGAAVKIPAMRATVETAIASLQTAQSQFYASQHSLPADKWNLMMQLRIAQAEWADIKENPYAYPYTVSEALTAAIAQAEAVIAKENATEQDISAAYRALVDAVNEKKKYDAIPGQW